MTDTELDAALRSGPPPTSPLEMEGRALTAYRKEFRRTGTLSRLQDAAKRQHFQIRVWRWALVATTLVLVTTPIYRNVRQKKNEAERERADTLLLKRVDAGVSREIPKAMEPLM